MIQKKICMLGAFAVGKTSLVTRFVESIFTDKYLTTVGVKIDKKSLKVGELDVNLILWDLAGEDDFSRVKISYLRGASGYLLVVDGTRRATLDTALALQKSVDEVYGKKLPFVLLLNKLDLLDKWALDEDIVAEFVKKGWHVLKTSAKTGQEVEDAFMTLTRIMLDEST
jgi:small GTP-binding protein